MKLLVASMGFLVFLTSGCSNGPINPDRIDNISLNNKFLFGYQGWFSAAGDGSPINGWKHWTRDNGEPTSQNVAVELWPDMSDFDKNEKFQTKLKLPDGTTASVFSSYRYETVRRHFDWMKHYGLDGVLLQRFVVETTVDENLRFMNAVLANVSQSASETGRVFAIMYDVSGANPDTVVNDIIKDWTSLINNLNLANNDRYLHHRGLPLLGIWGFGFRDRPIKVAQAAQLLDWFDRAPQEYKATLLGGVPTNWRLGGWDASPEPGWDQIYRRFTVLSPWFVGRAGNIEQIKTLENTIIAPDLKETQPLAIDYMPTIYPGFSWTNHGGKKLNGVARSQGQFFWQQIHDYISMGNTMLYGAMFDELDEGTAIMKCESDKSHIPVSPEFAAFSEDGNKASNDLYLRMAGRGTRILDKREPLK